MGASWNEVPLKQKNQNDFLLMFS